MVDRNLYLEMKARVELGVHGHNAPETRVSDHLRELCLKDLKGPIEAWKSHVFQTL